MVYKERYMDDQVSGLPQAGHVICTVEIKRYIFFITQQP